MVSTKSTLEPDSKEDQDSKYDPADQAYLERMAGHVSSGIDQAEAFANDPKNQDSNEEVRNKEENPDKAPSDAGWRSSYRGGNGGGEKVTAKAFLKKKGPIGGIVALVLGGSIVGTMLFSPGLMLVQMKEMLLDRFNYQEAVMGPRSKLMLDKKITSTFTTGVCTNVVSVKCKFSTISNRQAARLKAAGVDIENGAQKFGGRVKPTTIIFNGESISAKDFKARYNADVELRNAMRKAYNPRFAGFADKVWAKVATKIGVTKQRALPDGDAKEKSESIKEKTKEGTKLSLDDPNVTCEGSQCTNADGGTMTTEEARAAAQASKEATEEAVEEAAQAAANTAKAALGGAAKSVAAAVAVTGVVDVGCQAYSSVRALGFAAKTVRSLQLARYAMVWLNTADQIKDGTAKPEDVSYLGEIATTVEMDEDGNPRKPFMDSFGMQYTQYGTVGKADNYVNQFMAGGGLTGDLIGITSYIGSLVGGAPRETCKTLSNGWVQAGSIAAGVALLLIPGVNVAWSGKATANLVIAGVLSVALALLPELMKDILAGNVVDGIVGEDAGNAVASGYGTMAGDLAQEGGGAPMSIEQGVEFVRLQDEVVAQYHEDEASTLSPLDPTSSHTFVGSIVAKLLPYSSNVKSGLFTSAASSLASTVGSSLGSVIPTSSAAANATTEAALTYCKDDDYANYLEIATDPFCNPIYGIPAEYINKDPIVVVDELLATSQIDQEGVVIPGSEYEEYISHCIERSSPLGDTGQSLNGDPGLKCKIDSDMKANYYLYRIDSRIDDGMDGYEEGSGTASTDNLDKKALAQKIVAKDNITYGPYAEPLIAQIADGGVDPSAQPCGVNSYILKVIDTITDKHSIRITSLNRDCINSTVSGKSSSLSRHYAGNGSAIDIALIDGKATNGRDANALAVIALIMPILSEAGKKVDDSSGVGQVNCGTSVALLDNVKTFNDFCNHLHIDVPPASDDLLQFTKGGW